MICCNHCDWHYEYGSTQAEADKALELFKKHGEDVYNAWAAKYAPRKATFYDEVKDNFESHLGFTVYGDSSSVTYK